MPVQAQLKIVIYSFEHVSCSELFFLLCIIYLYIIVCFITSMFS